jgi:hypothetical protein
MYDCISMLIKKIYFLLFFLSCLGRDTVLIDERNNKDRFGLPNQDKLPGDTIDNLLELDKNQNVKNVDKNQNLKIAPITLSSPAKKVTNHKSNKKKSSLSRKRLNKKKIKHMYKKLTSSQKLALKKRLNQKKLGVVEKDKNKILPKKNSSATDTSRIGSSVHDVAESNKGILQRDGTDPLLPASGNKNQSSKSKQDNKVEKKPSVGVDFRAFHVPKDVAKSGNNVAIEADNQHSAGAVEILPEVPEEDEILPQHQIVPQDGILPVEKVSLEEIVFDIYRLGKKLAEISKIDHNPEIRQDLNNISHLKEIPERPGASGQINAIIAAYNNKLGVMEEFGGKDYRALEEKLINNRQMYEDNLIKLHQNIIKDLQKLQSINDSQTNNLIKILYPLFENNNEQIIGPNSKALLVQNISEDLMNEDQPHQRIKYNDMNYKKLLKLTHPDTYPRASEETKRFLRQIFNGVVNMKKMGDKITAIDKAKKITDYMYNESLKENNNIIQAIDHGHDNKNTVNTFDQVARAQYKANLIVNLDKVTQNKDIRGIANAHVKGLQDVIKQAQNNSQPHVESAPKKPLLAIENGPKSVLFDKSTVIQSSVPQSSVVPTSQVFSDGMASVIGADKKSSFSDSSTVSSGISSSEISQQSVRDSKVIQKTNDIKHDIKEITNIRFTPEQEQIISTLSDQNKEYIKQYNSDEISKILSLGAEKVRLIDDISKIRTVLPYIENLQKVKNDNFKLLLDLLIRSSNKNLNEKYCVMAQELGDKFRALSMVGDKIDAKKLSLLQNVPLVKLDQIFAVAKKLDIKILQSLSADLSEKLLQIDVPFEWDNLHLFSPAMLAVLNPDIVMTLLEVVPKEFLLHIKNVYDQIKYKNLYTLIIENKEHIVPILSAISPLVSASMSPDNKKLLLEKLLSILMWLQNKQVEVINNWDPKKVAILIKNMDLNYVKNLSHSVFAELKDYDNDKLDTLTTKINTEDSKNFSVSFAKAIKVLDKAKINQLDKIPINKKSFFSKLFSSIPEANSIAVLDTFEQTQLDALENNVVEAIGKTMTPEKIKVLTRLSLDQLHALSPCYIDSLAQLPVDHIESMGLIDNKDITDENCKKIIAYIKTYKKNMIDKFNKKNIKGFDNNFVIDHSKQLQGMADDLFNTYITPESVQAFVLLPQLFDMIGVVSQNEFFDFVKKINGNKNKIHEKIKKIFINKSMNKSDLFKNGIFDKIDLISDDSDILKNKNIISILNKISIDYLKVELGLDKKCMVTMLDMINILDEKIVSILFSVCFDGLSKHSKPDAASLEKIKKRLSKLFCNDYFDSNDLKNFATWDKDDLLVLLDKIDPAWYPVIKENGDTIKQKFNRKMNLFLDLPKESIPMFKNNTVWNFLTIFSIDNIAKIKLLESDLIQQAAENDYFDVLLTIGCMTKDAIETLKTLDNDTRQYVSEKVSDILNLGGEVDLGKLQKSENKFDSNWINTIIQEYQQSRSKHSHVQPIGKTMLFQQMGNSLNMNPVINSQNNLETSDIFSLDNQNRDTYKNII